jgi:putative colanic acid biosysnthesis UDP-glucose lipid carrier transferase
MNRSLLKQNAPLFESLLRLADPLVIFVAGVIVHSLYLPDVEMPNAELPDRYLFAFAGMAALTAIVFPIMGLYGSRRGVTAFEEVRQIVRAVGLLALIWSAFLFFSKTGVAFSRVGSIYWFALTLVTHLVLRSGIRLFLRQLRRRGYNLRHVVIVGAGRLGTNVAQRLREAPWAGFAIRGYYDDDENLHGQTLAGAPVLGAIDRMFDDLDTQGVDQVWIALPLRSEERIREVMTGLLQHSLQIRFVPDIYNFNLLHHSVSEIEGLPVINLTDSPLHGPGLIAKNVEDFVLALVLVLLAAPALLAIALGVKLSSPGPVLYRQDRVTWNGNRFSMLKFRSMPVDSEAEGGPVWSRPGEARATPFGSFLRRYSLDELPQLFNVLKGEMSIVGPRPERPEFVQRFKRDIPGYMQKHLVKAGITGWAQVNDLRGDTSLTQRIQYDLYYIENWSIWFDLRIIGLTLLHIARSKNAY